MFRKKEYIIGDFRTDDLNDKGIATYYYKQWTFLQEQNFEFIKRLTEKDEKIQQLEQELENLRGEDNAKD